MDAHQVFTLTARLALGYPCNTSNLSLQDIKTFITISFLMSCRDVFLAVKQCVLWCLQAVWAAAECLYYMAYACLYCLSCTSQRLGFAVSFKGKERRGMFRSVLCYWICYWNEFEINTVKLNSVEFFFCSLRVSHKVGECSMHKNCFQDMFLAFGTSKSVLYKWQYHSMKR